MLPSDTESFGRYVVDLLAFIHFMVNDLNVPGYNARTRLDGIVLLEWFKGCTYVTALLAAISEKDSLPTSFCLPPNILDRYIPVAWDNITTVILFEPGGPMGQPNTVVQVIPGGNHFAMATDPEEFNSGILSIIRELAIKVERGGLPMTKGKQVLIETAKDTSTHSIANSKFYRIPKTHRTYPVLQRLQEDDRTLPTSLGLRGVNRRTAKGDI
ncbi:hypothetical protein CALCODRAFT_508014 [Calocera cornea HHB12733]|uniref:Alpha/beta-hydrolase n=1 Tax=Calocera cornea HHB12733 TaxID=1353952 RepID=A0A165H0K6_9BASI|nr:hypothetical protein CALCODRAFT_508014 [Calocera cornea HHB12733]